MPPKSPGNSWPKGPGDRKKIAKQEGETRRAFLQHMRSLFGMSVAATILGTAIYKNNLDEADLQQALERNLSEALKRRHKRFSSNSLITVDLKSLTREQSGSNLSEYVDFKEVGLDKMRWGDESGIYFNGEADATENTYVDFTKTMHALQNKKTDRLNESLVSMHHKVYTELALLMRKSGKGLAVIREGDPKKRDGEYVSNLRAISEKFLNELKKVPDTDTKRLSKIEANLESARTAAERFADVAALSKTLAIEYEDLRKSGNHKPTSIHELTDTLNNQCNTLHNAIDWQRFGDTLPNDKQAALQHITNSINANVLIANSMTELLTGIVGSSNYEIYNLICRHAGKEFLARAPARGDNLVSFGPWQHTRYSVNDPAQADLIPHDPLAKTKGGATRLAHYFHKDVSEALKPRPLLEEVITFEEHAHITYLNAVFNSKVAIGILSTSQVHKLSTLNQRDIALFVNLAHHRPAVAARVLKVYLHKLEKHVAKALPGTPAKPPTKIPEFVDYVPKDLKLYVVKTAANYDALAAAKSTSERTWFNEVIPKP